MQLRTTSVATCLALLSSAADSSPPLAFTASAPYDAPAAFAGGRARTVVLRAVAEPDDSAQHLTLRPSTRTRPNDVTAAESTSTAISMIADSEKEFEVNLGRAVDTLKSDYPKLLTDDPSWNIYHADLEVVDPTGVSLHGLENYKKAFSFIHGVVKWFYCEEKSALTSVRLGYDWARKCIRVSWNVEMVPKMIYGGTRNTLYVDGISEYYLDRASGLINEHKVSHLLINNQAVEPERGIFHALAEMSPVEGEGGIPVYSKQKRTTWEDSLTNHIVKFETWKPFTQRPTSLFASPNDSAMSLSGDGAPTDLSYDLEAFQKKNKSRVRFGAPPLTPEEFVKIDEEVRAMDRVNKKKAAYLAEQFREQTKKAKKPESFLSNLFGGALKNGCESNFDCERPQVCCEVLMKKYCCSDGLGIVEGIPVEKYERALLRVPMANDDYDRNPSPNY